MGYESPCLYPVAQKLVITSFYIKTVRWEVGFLCILTKATTVGSTTWILFLDIISWEVNLYEFISHS